jgi:hypothetical protein
MLVAKIAIDQLASSDERVVKPTHKTCIPLLKNTLDKS